MSTQTKAQRLIAILENRRMDDEQEAKQDLEAATELRRLEAANAELLESLVDLVCLYPLDSTDAIITSARAAIKKHGGAA